MSQLKKLNTYNTNFVSEDPIELKLDPNEPLKFISEDDLKEKFQTESPEWNFRQDVAPNEYTLEIYCITDDGWPDAPPRIIVHTR